MFVKWKNIVLFVLTVLVFSTGCRSVVRFSTTVKDVSQNSVTNTNPKKTDLSNDLGFERSMIIGESFKWLGTPYCWGGESKDCADCSGFVQKVYAKAGIHLPRTSRQQYNYSSAISSYEAQPGDLVFFSENGTISHVGIYIGKNTIIHSSSSIGVIKQSLENNWLKSRLKGYGRVINS